MNLIQSDSHDSSALLPLRRWKPAAPESHRDMCIDGSDIRFIDRTLPEMKYMFHALYTHVPDETPGHPIPYGTAEKLQKRSHMRHVCQLLAEHEMGS